MTEPTLVETMPPQDLEAEQLLLACLMLARPPLTLLEKLTPAHFYRVQHQEILTAIQTLYARRGRIDQATVASELRRVDLLSECGGVEYLTALCAELPAWQHYQTHFETVDRAHGNRALIEIGRSLQTAALADPERPTDVAIAHAERLQALRSGYDSAELVSSFADEFIERLEADRAREWRSLRGMVSGIACIDNAIGGLGDQRLVLFKGLTKFGKTTFACQFLFESLQQGIAGDDGLFLAYWLEDTQEEFLRRYICYTAGVTMGHLRPGGTHVGNPAQDEPRIHAAERRIRTLPLRVATSLRTIEEIEADIRAHALDKRIVGVLVDNAQLVETARGQQSRERELSLIASRLAGVAVDLETTILLPSQVTKQLDGNYTTMHARALEQACSLSLTIERGEPGMSRAERVVSPTVLVYCDAARNIEPLGIRQLHGDFAHFHLYDLQAWQALQAADAAEGYASPRQNGGH